VIGCPPVLVGGDHDTLTVGVPEPRLRSVVESTYARGATTLPGGLNAVVLAADAAAEPFAL
jgi:hypothetical protein